MKRIEVVKENDNYNIDIIDENKYLAGTIIDLKRNQYYLILPDGYDKESLDFIVDNIINKIALKQYNKEKQERVGDIKTYAEELLLRELNFVKETDSIIIENLGILTKSENNSSNIRYISSNISFFVNSFDKLLKIY